ncbi:MAG: DUF1127 domain-containing protein [Gemmobacter sp.]|jgi:hypothetical protein|nr:DUF1127 domain-containing protein [Gemmobacter sp.]
MRERLQAVFARWRSLNEIAALSGRDLHDMGMTRHQAEDFARMPADTTARLVKMAAIFGLTEAELQAEHNAWLEMVQTCGHCGVRRECAGVLGHAETAHPDECGFCPNAAEYADRAAMKAPLD